MKYYKIAITAAILATSNTISAATYSYTSDSYSQGSNLQDSLEILGSYNTSMQISWSFDTFTDLAANLDFADVSGDVLSYSFFDGRNTLTEQNSIINDFFVYTDETGDLFNWRFEISTHPNANDGGRIGEGETAYRIISDLRFGFDNGRLADFRSASNVHQGDIYLCQTEGGCDSFYFNQGVADRITIKGPTTYVSAPSAVPVPAAVWLFSSGLLGLIGLARRKKV